MQKIQPWRMRGVAATIKNAAAGTETTTYNPTDSDGDIIGVSLNQPYSNEICGNIYISIKQGDKQPVIGVPMTQLIPVAGQRYYPVDLKKSGQITIDVETVTSDGATAKKPVITFHFKNPNESASRPGTKPGGCRGTDDEV